MRPSHPDPPAGWYPDPTGDWEQRFWDGAVWTEHVHTGPFGTQAPVGEPTLPGQEQLVWTDGRHTLTTHRFLIREQSRTAEPVQILLWTVVDVSVRGGWGGAATAQGTVVVAVDFPGYTDRRHWTAPRVLDIHRVAAYVRLWANRNRRHLPAT